MRSPSMTALSLVRSPTRTSPLSTKHTQLTCDSKHSTFELKDMAIQHDLSLLVWWR
eukprot:m.12957 g.12957  ORF g.12957 m.12957 type:complete len:56 (-) comp10063_c0_seq1:873-1040(-)